MTSSPERTRQVALAVLAITIAAVTPALTAACAPSSSPVNQDNWPGWLGPEGMPVADNPALPASWSPTENIEWAAEVPGVGWSSPVVWGNRVFLTAATSEMPMKQPSYGVDFSNDYIAELQAQGLEMEEIIDLSNQRDAEYPEEIEIELHVYCLDLESGEMLWDRKVYEGNPAVGRHRKNSYASETPVTDGEALYVYFAHLGLYAYDFDGNQLWATPLDSYQIYFDFGGGTSPALHGDRIFIVNDNEEASFVAGFDKNTGEQLWHTLRPWAGEPMGSAWSAPRIWENDLRTEIVTQAKGHAISYDLDGNELWRMTNMGSMPIPTPLVWDGLLYIPSGPPGGKAWPLAAIRPGAVGDITLEEGATSSEHIVWFDWKGGIYLSTPVIYDGAMYVLQDKGIFIKRDAKTGEIIYRARIAPGAANFTSSPWAYNGMIFCLSEQGDTYVIGSGDEYELLGTNSLDEFSMATPAMVGDRLLLRTKDHLYSIREDDGGS